MKWNAKVKVLLGVSGLLVTPSLSLGLPLARANTVHITFWESYVADDQVPLQHLIAQFNQTHPGIVVKAQYVPSGSGEQKLVAAVASGTAPDVAWIQGDLQPLVQGHAIYNLSKWYHQIPQATRARIYPSLVENAKWQGKLFSVPIEATDLGIVYNAHLFQEAHLALPTKQWTWQQFAADVKRLSDPAKKQYGFMVPDFVGSLAGYESWIFQPFMWDAGGRYAGPKGKPITYNDAGAVKALEFWHSLVTKDGAVLSSAASSNAFQTGKLAMYIDGPWDIPSFAKLPFKWGVAWLPKGPKVQATNVGGEYLAVFRQSKHPMQAWDFVKWWMAPAQETKWAVSSGYLPITSGVSQVPAWKSYAKTNQGASAFASELKIGYTEPGIVDQNQTDANLATAIQEVLLGKASAKAALSQAVKTSNQEIASGGA